MFQWLDLGGVLYMYYWATNKQFGVETALMLQFLSNLDYKNSFVYWTIIVKTNSNPNFDMKKSLPCFF